MKRILSIMLALAVVLCAAGCGSAFSDEYYFSEPFREPAGSGDGTETEVRNASTLKRAIMELVYAGETSGQFRFGSYSGSLMDDLAAVCLEIKTSTPMGAYAVEDISYDTSRIVSYYTADISIKYKKTAEEIASVVELSGLGELGSHLLSVMESGSTGTVVKIYSSAANEEYIRSFIADSYYADPLLVADEPTVSVSAFPDAGPERIYVIYLRYGAIPERLEAMDMALEAAVSEAVPGLGGEDSLWTALNCADYVAKLCAEETETGMWSHTAYGAFVEGRADSYGMAMAYKALCDSLGIECRVVRGEKRAAAAEGCAWNIIGIEGEYYHVDLSRFAKDATSAFLLSDEDIWGEYDWDREAYPLCDGSLGPEDVFVLPVAEPENTPPAESEPPEESPEISPELPPEESPEPSAPPAGESLG